MGAGAEVIGAPQEERAALRVEQKPGAVHLLQPKALAFR